MKKLIIALFLLSSASNVFANDWDDNSNDFQIQFCANKVSYTFKTIEDGYYLKSRRFNVFELNVIKEGKLTGAGEYDQAGLRQMEGFYKQNGINVTFVYGTRHELDKQAYISIFKDNKGEIYSLINLADGKVLLAGDTVQCKEEKRE